MKKIFSPKILLIISMSIFGTIGLFVRYIPLPSGEIALYRSALAIIFIGFFMLITKQKISFKGLKKQIILLCISGLALAFNWIFLFEAYKYTAVSVATVSYYFAPVIVTILSPVLFKEKIGIKGVICFVLSSVGIVLVTGLDNFQADNKNLLGIAYGLLAAVLYATVVLMNKLIKNIDGIQRTFLQFVFAFIVLLPYTLLTNSVSIASIDGTALIFLLTIGIIHTGIAYCMYFSSIKDLSGQKAAILSYIDPLIAVLLSVFILKEQITALQWTGVILSLGFTALNELLPNKKQKN